MMKRILIASAIAVSLVSATGAPAHDDENHGKKEDRHTNGHATASESQAIPTRSPAPSRWK